MNIKYYLGLTSDFISVFYRITYDANNEIAKVELLPLSEINTGSWIASEKSLISYQYNIEEESFFSKDEKKLERNSFTDPARMDTLAEYIKYLSFIKDAHQAAYALAHNLSENELINPLQYFQKVRPSSSNDILVTLIAFLGNNLSAYELIKSGSMNVLAENLYNSNNLETLIKAYQHLARFIRLEKNSFRETFYTQALLLLEKTAQTPLCLHPNLLILPTAEKKEALALDGSLIPLAPEIAQSHLDPQQQIIERIAFIQTYLQYDNPEVQNLLISALQTLSQNDLKNWMTATNKYGDKLLFLALTRTNKKFLEALLVHLGCNENNRFMKSDFLNMLLTLRDEQNVSFAVYFFSVFPQKLASILALKRANIKHLVISECVQLAPTHESLFHSLIQYYPNILKTWLNHLPPLSITKEPYLSGFTEGLYIAVNHNLESLNILLLLLKKQNLSLEQNLSILSKSPGYEVNTAFHMAVFKRSTCFLKLWDFLQDQGASLPHLIRIFHLKGFDSELVFHKIIKHDMEILFNLFKSISSPQERNSIRKTYNALKLPQSFIVELENAWKEQAEIPAKKRRRLSHFFDSLPKKNESNTNGNNHSILPQKYT